ncbi:general transcription factor IIH subunit 3 isoform X2 [Anabrus simplex]|uniref:general transcription factor IIH subunit 3 isoform X2 n=1 Tax=Anabrus simplex TaxID=316456 RepID=UPI0034DD195C
MRMKSERPARKYFFFTVQGKGLRGRSRKCWIDTVKSDVVERGLKGGDVLELEDGIERSVLVVILDINGGQKLIKEQPSILTQCIESVIAFSNSHLMLKSTNRLAVLACHSTNIDFLYPSPGVGHLSAALRQYDGQYELFTHVEKTIRQNMQKQVSQEVETYKSGNVEALGDSLIAGALCMALCYIRRLQHELTTGCKMNSRVLVVTASGYTTSQYMTFMNAFFTAQKQNVTIDVCSLDEELSLLQQGCDITGGLYLRVPQLQGLLQYLLWVFLPEPTIRSKLVLPPPVEVDYRAACFCHRQLIDIGYVCSVCLSIFCKYSPICTTCNAVFKNPPPVIAKSRKKKLKVPAPT